MKFMHLSDLHIGKRVNEFSMTEDQRYILNQILETADMEKPDGILIAGDIYDKSMPSEEAVRLLNDFICALSRRNIPTYIISGNHDSAERLAFGAQLMDVSGIHINSVYDGSIARYDVEDKYGGVSIFLLPFIKPVHVKKYYPDEEINSYSDAVKIVINHTEINQERRNILVTHQFVTGAARSDSEDISVGGSDNVDVSVFEGFDYIALGHIHRPQKLGRETVRYCGTPLKYSFSEENHIKSVTIVELKEKGNTSVRTIPLVPLHDMRTIRGSYDELCRRSYYEHMKTDDYIQVILTDEDDVPDAIGRLRTIYPNIMTLKYDNARTRSNTEITAAENVEKRNPLELFGEFYEKQNNRPMSDEQRSYMHRLIEEIWEGGL